MRFLILKTSSLGDILQAFPVLDYLKNLYPDCEIDWVVEKPYSELLLAHPLIARVITVETKKWRKTLFSTQIWQEINTYRQEIKNYTYDAAFDLQGNTKSGMLLSQVKAKFKVGFGRKSVPEWPNLFFTDQIWNPPLGKNIREDYLFLLQSHFKNFTPIEMKEVVLKGDLKKIPHNDGKKILVCPGAFWPNKRLPEAKLTHFLQILSKREKSYFYFVWGNEDEKKVGERISKHFSLNSCILEKLSLVALQGVMRQVDLVVAMDSLPLHLCGTTKTPAYGFFGPSSSHKYLPLGKEKRAFQGKCPFNVQFEKRCPYLRSCKNAPCIHSIDFLPT